MKILHTAAICLAALGALCSWSVQAQRMYKCTDAKGKIYYTQVPPDECLGKDTQELSRQGRVTKRTEAPLTPEQQAARDEERKKQAEKEAVEREARRRNQALLSTYSSEKDLEEARARTLKENEAAMAEIQKLIASAEKRKKELEAEKEFYLKKPMPPKLQEDLKNNETEIRTQRGAMDARKKQITAINAKYDEDKKRYLELTRVEKAPAVKAGSRK